MGLRAEPQWSPEAEILVGVRDEAHEAENILYTFIQAGPKVKDSVVRVCIRMFCDYYVQASASPYFGSLGRGRSVRPCLDPPVLVSIQRKQNRTHRLFHIF